MDAPLITVEGWRAFQTAYAQFDRDARTWDDERLRVDAIAAATGDAEPEPSRRPQGE